MTTVLDQLLNILQQNNINISDIDIADVFFDIPVYGIMPKSTHIIKTKSNDVESFLSSIDKPYTSGHYQSVYGRIWLKTGSWLDRRLVDTVEQWIFIPSCQPSAPAHLLK